MANNQLLASDNFQRANGALGANWTAASTYLAGQIVSNQVEPNTTNVQTLQYFSGLTWPKDHASEVTLGTGWVNEGNTFLILTVRTSAVAATWYQVNIGNNGALSVYRVVAGAATQIGATVNSLNFTAGDIISFQVAGSVLHVYQNYARIYYGADDAIVSGSPGFGGLSTTITHTTVSAWRGYSAIQQDGIWQKQGIVLPLAAGDIASSGYGVYDIAAILYEGNAQLLSGTVYKMWFTGGGINAGNPGSTFYAESLDGVTWTRRVGAVISGISCQSLTKNGSTYYMYSQLGTQQGTGPIYLHTSTDGINWTQISSNILAVGTAGAWDDTNIYALCCPVIVGGTWYMLYTGAGTPATGTLFKVGLATSPDGITWTKYGSNPILSNAVPGPIVKVGNIWYIWVAAGPSSPQMASGSIHFDPAETVRYQSTDLINWTNPVRSVHHSQIFESLNTTSGASTACTIIDIGGKAYMYLVGCPSDSVAPQYYQIELAIAPSTTAAIVGFNEDAVSPVATDNFTSGIGNLSANWTTPTGGTKLQIVAGNKVEATTLSAYNMQCYTGSAFSNDQSSDITVAAMSAGVFLAPAVRVQTNANSGYVAQFVGPAGSLGASTTIVKVVNGAGTVIGPAVACTPNVGDVFRMTAIGNVLSLYQNGALLLQVEDTSNTFASGNPGIAIYTTTTLAGAQISAWAGGNANVIPSYFPPDDPTLPYIGCVSLASGDAGQTQFVGHVRVIASPRAGVPNPYLGNMYVVTAPVGRDDKLLGEVTVVSGPPAGTQGTDSYLGHIAEE